MTAQNKKTLVEIVILVACILVIVFGGRYERGYYAIASEPFVAVFGAFVIWIRRNKK